MLLNYRKWLIMSLYQCSGIDKTFQAYITLQKYLKLFTIYNSAVSNQYKFWTLSLTKPDEIKTNVSHTFACKHRGVCKRVHMHCQKVLFQICLFSCFLAVFHLYSNNCKDVGNKTPSQQILGSVGPPFWQPLPACKMIKLFSGTFPPLSMKTTVIIPWKYWNNILCML